MISARRLGWNFGLQRAVDYAVALRKPLVILEALRCDYPGANDRLHRFVLDGMAVNRRHAARSRALYYPYVEPAPGHGRELLPTLAASACVVVTDWYPAFFLPRMIAAAAARLTVRLEAIDSNGVIPLAEHGRAFTAARFYRAFMQRVLREHVTQVPDEAPLDAPEEGPATLVAAEERDAALARGECASLDRRGHSAFRRCQSTTPFRPVRARGGHDAAARTLRRFVTAKLSGYDAHRNHPDDDGTSRLSPYLHFGHMSAHEVFSAVMTHERWTTRRLGDERRAAGAKAGGAYRRRQRRFSTSSSSGASSRSTAASTSTTTRPTIRCPSGRGRRSTEHGDDPRPHTYTLERLEAAADR